MNSFFINSHNGRKEIFSPSPKLISDNQPTTPKKQSVSHKPTMFEPKVYNRFIVFATDKKGNEIVPPFLIKKVSRPTFHYNWLGIRKTDPLTIEIYDAIVPSGMQCIMQTINRGIRNWTLTIKLLGPVGDVIEEWYIPKAKVMSISSQTLDWASDNDPLTINVTFDIGRYRGIQ